MEPLLELLKHYQNIKVIDASIGYDAYLPLDLSVTNAELASIGQSTSDFEKHIESFLMSNNGKVAYGGYNEKRNLYKRSEIFNDDTSEERDIHIGLDLWIAAGTQVLAALDGSVHSFNYNKGIGNYGPTMILQHHEGQHTFHTLYGHLSLESIDGLEIGIPFKKGQTIGILGTPEVNGDYAPHLHFQIIIDIEGYFGDYPGVCNKKKLDFYLANCPDPNLLLKI